MEHTANIFSTGWIAFRVGMVVVKCRANHGQVIGRWPRGGNGGRGEAVTGNTCWTRTTGASHVVGMLLGRNGFPVVDFGHSPHATAAETRILVTVAPAVDGALDKATLASQTRVQFRQCPAHCVTLCLVDETVPTVLVLAAAGARVDAIFGLEVGAQMLDIDGLDITSNGVLELDAIPRVFKRDPLHTVSILPHNQWGGGGNRTRSSIGVRPRRRVGMVTVLHRSARVCRIHSSSLRRGGLLLIGIKLHARAGVVHGSRVCLWLLVRHLSCAAHEKWL